MNTIAKTLLFVLAPMVLVMVAAGAWFHYSGIVTAQKTSQRQLNSAAQLTSRLVQTHIEHLEQALESILVQQYLDEYDMFQQVGLFDEAEDARLWIELALERLTEANPEVKRIECYTPQGERFVAVVNGRRELAPAQSGDAEWFEVALSGKSYQRFDSNRNIRLARGRHTEHDSSPIAVVTLLFDYTTGATQAAQFATRHLEQAQVQLINQGELRFTAGSLIDEEGEKFSATAPLELLNSKVVVSQSIETALATFYSAQRVLYTALAMVTLGLILIAAVGTKLITRDLRAANHRIDEANNQLREHTKHIEQANQQLEAKTTELATRTEELANANAELERSNKDLTDFAHVASHDLQAPLRGINGFARLLEEDYHDKLDERGKMWIAQIIDGTNRMSTLIRDLLAYSRVETRGQQPAPTNMQEVFESVVQLLRAPIKETNAQVTADELPTLSADRAQMTQLLQNLIGNAIKYQGDNTPEVKVSARRTHRSWEFSVKDNGIGIDPKYRERVFELFKRLHTQEDYAGTGIGLAICRRVVQRHGGEISIESNPEGGSIFSFTIPDAPNSAPR